MDDIQTGPSMFSLNLSANICSEGQSCRSPDTLDVSVAFTNLINTERLCRRFLIHSSRLS
jgi:hypothetical protein